MRRWSGWGFAAVVFIGSTGCATRAVFGPIPSRDGEVSLPGLSAPATVSWDSRGIPTVEAASFADALRAEGYLHARFRPIQVEFRRRAVRAELAAVGGAGLLPMDKQTLSTGMRDFARKEEASLTPENRALIEAYLEGLNAGLAEVDRQRPLIWSLVKTSPGRWEVIDVLTFGRRFAAELSDAAQQERARWDMLIQVGEKDLAHLWEVGMGDPFPPLPPETALIARRVLAARQPSITSAILQEEIRSGEASNAWAVGSTRTRDHGALLAGDPHLSLDLPSIWFEVRLSWPGGFLSGASLAGAPAVIIGHNGKVAWSFTSALFDDADLFLAEVDDVERPARYRENGVWKEFHLEKHLLTVQGSESVEYEVRRAGSADYLGPSGVPRFGLLRRWASIEAGGFVEGILNIGRARDVAEVLAAGYLIPGPGQNLIAADHLGNTLQAVVGCYPVRQGDGWDGRLPQVWRGDSAWKGCLDKPRLPASINPPAGFTFSANEPGLAAAPREAGQVALVGDYDRPYRSDRIRKVLEEKPAATPEDMRTLLNDARSLFADEVANLLTACQAEKSKGPGVAAYLAWDRTASGSGATLLHAVFQGELAGYARDRSRLKNAKLSAFFSARPFLRLLAAARSDQTIARWIDDPGTATTEDPCAVLKEAMERAWTVVTRAAGPDPQTWDWGSWHQLTLRSPIGSGPLAGLTNPAPVPLAGLRETVLAQSFRIPPGPFSGRPFEVIHGPSYRMIVHFPPGETAVARSIIPGGQDEHPGSPHAFDQLSDYAKGALLPLDPPEKTESSRLTFHPIK